MLLTAILNSFMLGDDGPGMQLFKKKRKKEKWAGDAAACCVRVLAFPICCAKPAAETKPVSMCRHLVPYQRGCGFLEAMVFALFLPRMPRTYHIVRPALAQASCLAASLSSFYMLLLLTELFFLNY